jgi:hypothetical protein
MERELMRHLVQIWKTAGPELEAIRRREVAVADNRKVLRLLDGMFDHAVRTCPPSPSSGLVEMQRWFAKLPR